MCVYTDIYKPQVLPVRHAHDDVIYSALRRLVNDGFQGRNQRLASLQTKALLCRPLLLQELLEPEDTQTLAAAPRRQGSG